MELIKSNFQSLFDGRRSAKPHSSRHNQFYSEWGNHQALWEIAGKTIEGVRKANQEYLTSYLFWLTFLVKKGEAEEEEMKYQENLRKSKKK